MNPMPPLPPPQPWPHYPLLVPDNQDNNPEEVVKDVKDQSFR